MSRPSRQAPRRSAPRTTTGCLCCRIRRKKCDEIKPTCAGCERNILVCIWPQSRGPDQKPDGFGWKIRLQSGEGSGGVNEMNTSIHVLSVPADPPRRRNKSSPVCYAPLCSVPATGSAMSTIPNSSLLLQHYIAVTAKHLPVAMWMENLFISSILPSAHSNDLVMQGVLALSGVHLCYKSTSSDIKTATWTHYALALRGIKTSLTKAIRGEAVDALHLLMATLLLCEVERISGNAEGAMFHHLRASRELVLLELNRPGTEGDDQLRGFLLELYAYLALVGNITISTESGRTIDLDPFLFSLESLSQYPTFGFMFGCAYALYEIIPSICLLGRDRILEENRGQTPSLLANRYRSLQRKICEWKPPGNLEEGTDTTFQLITAAKIYQYGILIFLHASFHISNTFDPDLIAEVESASIAMIELLKAVSSRASSTVLWPMIIMGSCLRLPEQRLVVRQMFVESKFQMTSVSRAIQLLDWLWEDETAFGPVGLEIVMKRHRVNFCMA